MHLLIIFPIVKNVCFILFFSFFSDGVVSLNEYMSFMISRETENVRSAREVEEAFRAITEGGKQPYVTEEDLKSVSSLKVINVFYLRTPEKRIFL